MEKRKFLILPRLELRPLGASRHTDCAIPALSTVDTTINDIQFNISPIAKRRDSCKWGSFSICEEPFCPRSGCWVLLRVIAYIKFDLWGWIFIWLLDITVPVLVITWYKLHCCRLYAVSEMICPFLWVSCISMVRKYRDELSHNTNSVSGALESSAISQLSLSVIWIKKINFHYLVSKRAGGGEEGGGKRRRLR